MRLSTRGRFAITAMIDLALRDKAYPVPLSDLALRHGISLSYLEQVFSKLRQQGLVESTRGPGGGYTLGFRGDQITVADIIGAIEDPRDAADERAAPVHPLPGVVVPVVRRREPERDLEDALRRVREDERLGARRVGAVADVREEVRLERAAHAVLLLLLLLLCVASSGWLQRLSLLFTPSQQQLAVPPRPPAARANACLSSHSSRTRRRVDSAGVRRQGCLCAT